MRKAKRFLGIMAFVMLMWIFPVTAQAEGKLNTACICGTEDAKGSFNKMADLIEDNKMSLWRNTKKNVRMTFDSENKGSTIEAVNRTLDRAFGNSTSNDINYLYLSGHGTTGSGASTPIIYAESGLSLSNNCVYKFSDLAKKINWL